MRPGSINQAVPREFAPRNNIIINNETRYGTLGLKNKHWITCNYTFGRVCILSVGLYNGQHGLGRLCRCVRACAHAPFVCARTHNRETGSCPATARLGHTATPTIIGFSA